MGNTLCVMTAELTNNADASARPEPVSATELFVVDGTAAHPVLDIVVPVYNEEADLEDCVRCVDQYLRHEFPYPARITIADNASTDRTLEIGSRLAETMDNVRIAHLDAKGRGRALKAVWGASDADVVAYVDVDLSTDLNAMMPLVAPLISGHSDVSIGSRLAKSSRVVRGPKREFISRSYNLILKTTMRARFSDAQCGFKAIRTDVARQLLPLVKDTGWFFDTELLVLSERVGLRIAEVPVDWIDDPNSKVDILKTATEDLLGCYRVGRALAKGELPVRELRQSLGRHEIGPEVDGVPPGMISQLLRFGIIGVASTLAFALLFLMLHPMVGAQAANFLALLITAVANTAANRAFTFNVRGRDGAAKHQAQGIAVFLVTWGLTSGALFGLHHYYPHASNHVDLAALVVANFIATLLRFIAFRWIFRPRLERTTA